MNARTTYALLILAAALAAWLVYDLRKPPPPAGAGPLLRDYDIERVTRLEIERTGRDGARERLVFERGPAGSWRILEPVSGDVPAERIADLLELPVLRISGTVLEAGPDELEAYGLGASALRVVFTAPDGVTAIRIGARTSFQHGLYACVEGRPEVTLVDPDFDQPYRRPAQAFTAAPNPP